MSPYNVGGYPYTWTISKEDRKTTIIIEEIPLIIGYKNLKNVLDFSLLIPYNRYIGKNAYVK